MIKDNFTGRAAELGFKPAAGNDPNETLADIISSRIPAYWEAFPALLANAAERGDFSPQAVETLLSEADKAAFRDLALASIGLYRTLGLNFKWPRKLFPAIQPRQAAAAAESLHRGEPAVAAGVPLPAARLAAAYWRCRRGGGAKMVALEIFTPRQAQLFYKRLRGARLNKTEREYYSRVIRRKVLALADEELHRLARKALG